MDIEAYKEFEKKFVVIHVISAAFLISFVVLMVIPFVVELGGNAAGEREPMLKYILPLIAVVNLFTAPFMTKFVIRSSASQLKSGDISVQRIQQAVLPGILIGHAFRESAVIIGFVLSVLFADNTWVLTFGGLAILAMLYTWPKATIAKELLPPNLDS